MKKILYIISLGLALTSCNDSFMEREPVGSLVESNAFTSYDNFRAYMYKCYGLFTDGRIMTNNSGAYYHNNGQYLSDHYSGLMTDRDLWKNPYAYQTINTVTASNNWDFSSIRSINIMLSHLEDGALTEEQQRHWRSVGYFFHSWWYMELVARYGDIPYITTVLTDERPEAYGERTPRGEVANSIIERLE